jgi:hypothetical protein
MPTASNLPAPQSGSESFFQGAGVMNQLLNAIASRRAQQQQIKQAQEMMPYNEALKKAQTAGLNENVAASQFARDPQQQVNYMTQLINSLSGQDGSLSTGGQQQNITNVLSSINDPAKRNIARALIKRATGIDPLAPSPMTPEQKLQMQEMEKGSEATSTQDAKDLSNITNRLHGYVQIAEPLQDMKEVFKEHPYSSGRFVNWADYLNAIPNEAANRLRSDSQLIQANLTGEISSRPAFGYFKAFENAKPNVKASYLANKGRIASLVNYIKSQHSGDLKAIEQIQSTNPNLPKRDYSKVYALPENFEEPLPETAAMAAQQVEQNVAQSQGGGEKMVTYIDPDGGRHVVPLSVAQRLQGKS